MPVIILATIIFAIARFNSNGVLDNTFGSGGITINSIGNSQSKGNSLAIQSDGNIVLGGFSNNDSNGDIALVRYHGNINSRIGEAQITPGFSKLFPNPFNSIVKIQFNASLHNGELILYNATGQIVKQINNISGQEIQLSRDHLPMGLYLLRLSENNKVIASDKVVISN